MWVNVFNQSSFHIKQHYAKSINTLREHHTPGWHETTNRTLLTLCYLCYECLHGSYCTVSYQWLGTHWPQNHINGRITAWKSTLVTRWRYQIQTRRLRGLVTVEKEQGCRKLNAVYCYTFWSRPRCMRRYRMSDTALCYQNKPGNCQSRLSEAARETNPPTVNDDWDGLSRWYQSLRCSRDAVLCIKKVTYIVYKYRAWWGMYV